MHSDFNLNEHVRADTTQRIIGWAAVTLEYAFSVAGVDVSDQMVAVEIALAAGWRHVTTDAGKVIWQDTDECGPLTPRFSNAIIERSFVITAGLGGITANDHLSALCFQIIQHSAVLGGRPVNPGRIRQMLKEICSITAQRLDTNGLNDADVYHALDRQYFKCVLSLSKDMVGGVPRDRAEVPK